MDIITMQFTTGDIIELLGIFIIGLSAYVSIRKSVVKLEALSQVQEKELIEVKGKLNKVQDEDKIDKTEIWRKLATIESVQAETNVFLKENLKHLTFIIDSHENRLDNLDTLKDRIANYDNTLQNLSNKIEKENK